MGGKGGVGKTTCAAGLSLVHAARGMRVLAASTDPAASLGDALDEPLSGRPRVVSGTRARLEAVEIDARAAMRRWLRRRKTTLTRIALRGTWLDEGDVAAILGQTLPGLDELAALFEILRLVRCARYDVIVLDTAPTGHTLRLLELPQTLGTLADLFDRMQARHRAVVEALCGRWTDDPADALVADLQRDARELRALLRDPERADVSWTTLAEPMAVAESEDGIRALRRIGIAVERVIVNRLTPPPPERCGWCDRRRVQERRSLAELERALRRALADGHAPSLVSLPATDAEPIGVRALRRLGEMLERSASSPRITGGTAPGRPTTASVTGPACTALVRPGVRLLFFGGKGGVGKTTCAAAVALDLAERKARGDVLLLSTDPAHSLADALSTGVSDVPKRLPVGPRALLVRELDARSALQRVQRQITEALAQLVAARSAPGDEAQALLDLVGLAPPGLDEIAAILEVVDLLEAPGRTGLDLVVIDTAPTGHALRLLEMPDVLQRWVHTFMRIVLKYETVIGTGALGPPLLRLARGLRRLRAILADPGLTQFVIVTRAARLPRAETARLARSLARLRVPIGAAIVNAAGGGSCSRCRRAAAQEKREIVALADDLRLPVWALAPSTAPGPRGPRTLRLWQQTWRCPDLNRRRCSARADAPGRRRAGR